MQEFTLSNGLHFLVLERHNAPIVSCHTYADVGAFDEEIGQTGGSPPMKLAGLTCQPGQTFLMVPSSLCVPDCAGVFVGQDQQ